MTTYMLLDQVEEDALHASRLLTVEEKSFKRISRRLLNPDALISAPPTLFPTPPVDSPDSNDPAQAHQIELQRRESVIKAWRDDAILEFSAFESNILRHQFLFNSNEKERQRYAMEKDRIIATAQAVKDNTAELRFQLDEAQSILALRKTYDEQTKKITDNQMLRTRSDQAIAIEKLNVEITDLERESSDYAQTWAERRIQFEKIVEEGKQMLRLIRDEKEEADQIDITENEGDSDEKQLMSAAGTPGASGGAATPLHNSHSDEGTPDRSLAVPNVVHHSPTSRSARSSRVQTPVPGASQTTQDTAMKGFQVAGDEPVPESQETDLEDGEAKEDDDLVGEQMDVT